MCGSDRKNKKETRVLRSVYECTRELVKKRSHNLTKLRYGIQAGRSLDRARADKLAGIYCFHDKNACVARALTFYFRMKHTIRGRERETNVETGEGKKNPLGRGGGGGRHRERERERALSLLSRNEERETLFVLRRAI